MILLYLSQLMPLKLLIPLEIDKGIEKQET